MSETGRHNGAATGAADIEARGAQDSGGPDRPPRDAGGPPIGQKKRRPSRAIIIAVVGGLVTAGIAAVVVNPALIGGGSNTSSTEESVLEPLAPADITAALPTLDPATSKAAVDDARACKAPLTWVTLVQRPGGHGGMVRVRSGSYLSPPIQVTNTPQRIAIPYPAPYPTARGVLSLVGDADQVGFYLRPGGVWNVKGTLSVNVWWTVTKPCP